MYCQCQRLASEMKLFYVKEYFFLYLIVAEISVGHVTGRLPGGGVKRGRRGGQGHLCGALRNRDERRHQSAPEAALCYRGDGA